LNDIFDPVRVSNARQLHEHLIAGGVAVPLDNRFRDSDLIDAVANRFHRLNERFFPDCHTRAAFNVYISPSEEACISQSASSVSKAFRSFDS
jgi:hypothetical protein